MDMKATLLSRINQIGVNRNDVAEAQRAVSSDNARKFIYGNMRSCRFGLIEELLIILEMELVPKEVFDDLKSAAIDAVVNREINPDHYSGLRDWLTTGAHPRSRAVSVSIAARRKSNTSSAK